MKQKTVISLPETKSQQLNFYLSATEFNNLTERAEDIGLSKRALIRLALIELFKNEIVLQE